MAITNQLIRLFVFFLNEFRRTVHVLYTRRQAPEYSSGTQDMTRLSFFQWIFNNECVLFFLKTHPLDQRDNFYSLRLNSQYQSNEWDRI